VDLVSAKTKSLITITGAYKSPSAHHVHSCPSGPNPNRHILSSIHLSSPVLLARKSIQTKFVILNYEAAVDYAPSLFQPPSRSLTSLVRNHTIRFQFPFLPSTIVYPRYAFVFFSLHFTVINIQDCFCFCQGVCIFGS